MTLHQKTRTSEIWEIAGERVADALSYSGNPILATFTHPDEECDRIAQVEKLNRNFQYPFAVRRWGEGFWCRCDGQAAWFSRLADAEVFARRWIETGRGA